MSAAAPEYEVDDLGGAHQCNFFCRGDVHCEVLHTNEPLPDDVVAVVNRGHRFDIVGRQLAPEVPPVHPLAEKDGPWAYRYYLWTRSSS